MSARRWRLSLARVSARQRLTLEAPLLGLLLIVLAVSALVTPNMHLRVGSVDLPSVVLCPFFALTGIPCLFCGITRSFLAMGSFDVGSAFIFHPLGPAIFLALIALALAVAFTLVSGRRIRLELSAALRRRLIRWAIFIIILAWPLKLALWSHAGLL